MSITAQKDEVQFEVQILKTEERQPQKLLDREALRTSAMIRMCGWCNKIDVGQDKWSEVDEAVKALGFFEQEGFPQLTHTACLNCYRSMMKLLVK